MYAPNEKKRPMMEDLDNRRKFVIRDRNKTTVKEKSIREIICSSAKVDVETLGRDNKKFGVMTHPDVEGCADQSKPFTDRMSF